MILVERQKKEKGISAVNKDYCKRHKRCKIRIEVDEMWSFYQNKKHQVWLWWAVDHDTGEVIAFWFGSRKHKQLDKLLELLEPLKLDKVYTDGNYTYVEKFDEDVLVVSKKNTQKIERKHLSLRARCSRLVRKDIRFSKTLQMHKIVVGLTINVRFFGYNYWVQ